MDDIKSQIDEIVARLDENDNSLQEFSDNLDSTVSDMQDTITSQSDNLDTLNESAGQLTFPLSQETIDLIKEQFPSGFVTLVAGTVTLNDSRISPTSNIFLTVSSAGGNQGFISYVASTGQAVINSTSATDTSIISYVIFN